MTERPILFSAPMVRALLAGTKTQTRRVVKPQPVEQRDGWAWWHKGLDAGHLHTGADAMARLMAPLCPYGAPGDRLWVRETWARDSEDGALFYRADVGTGNEADDWQHNIDVGASGYRWRPSIHMPRTVSRITLEITAVRVERLQDISEADAIAEGVAPYPKCREDDDTETFSRIGKVRGDSFPIARYAARWEQINGLGLWDANPWVWVVEFARV